MAVGDDLADGIEYADVIFDQDMTSMIMSPGDCKDVTGDDEGIMAKLSFTLWKMVNKRRDFDEGVGNTP